MIERYKQDDIAKIWHENAKYNYFLDVELALLEAQEGHLLPKGSASKIRSLVKINPARIEQIEAETKHDIIAFCTHISEQIPAELARFFHFGATSSDIIDSALSLQLRDSIDIAISDLEKLVNTVKSKATKYKKLLAMGRSHGMFAEPLSFGQKLLGHHNELKRRLSELKEFRKNELTVQASGAVGSYTILTPELETSFAKILKMKVEPLSTQVIPRDRVAKLVTINALLAAAIERLSVEIRHLHRSEVGEVFEGFSKGQKGSSTMPHKKNPISTENLTGISRILKSHVDIALENIVLWHERDISHSSAERIYLPDNFGLLTYALRRMNTTIENLVIKEDTITSRVTDNFNYLSSYYLHLLLQQSNHSREELYKIIQAAAFNATDATNFAELIQKEIEEIKLPIPTKDQMELIFLSNIDQIFERSK